MRAWLELDGNGSWGLVGVRESEDVAEGNGKSTQTPNSNFQSKPKPTGLVPESLKSGQSLSVTACDCDCWRVSAQPPPKTDSHSYSCYAPTPTPTEEGQVVSSHGKTPAGTHSTLHLHSIQNPSNPTLVTVNSQQKSTYPVFPHSAVLMLMLMTQLLSKAICLATLAGVPSPNSSM